MQLSLVTINYNGADSTIKLLESLAKQTDQDFNIYVIDNASQKEDSAKLAAYLAGKERIHFIENLENKGFSGGCNTGIHKALADGSEWIILINNDTWVKEQFISEIKAYTSCRSGIVAIPTREGDDRIAYAGKVKWLKSTLPHIYDHRQAGRNSIYAIGAGVAIHKSVFAKIGFWDEKYFLYFEDADFSVRARKAGFKIDIAPIAINHEVSKSTSKLGALLLLRYHYRNAHLFNLKNGSTAVRFALPLWSGWIILKQIIKWMVMPHTRSADQAIIAGVVDFYKSRFGKII